MGQVFKKCTRCGNIKSLVDYYKTKNNKDGLYCECKVCFKERCNKYNSEHKEQHRQWAINRRLRNPERHRIEINQWRAKNPEKTKAQKLRSYKKERSTSKGKLNNAMRCRIWGSIKNEKAGRHWEDLVGYTVEQLKKHLEKLFTPDMTWENYGTVWEIDHKTPIAAFNFDKPEHFDFRICWDIKNLQPLECSKNRRKSDKLDKPFQPSLAIG
jgi:hypothetical protein